MSAKTDELERKLAEKKAKRDEQEDEQLEIDLEARLSLTDDHATIAAVKVSRFVVGQPTFALIRMPQAAEYKRYKDLTHRGVHAKNVKQVQDAGDQLGRDCWIYPESDEAKAAMLEEFPGLITPLSMAAAALAEGRSEDEGKG